MIQRKVLKQSKSSPVMLQATKTEKPRKWAKMRRRLQTMLGYEMLARSEKTHVFRCREIKTMRLNLKKRLCRRRWQLEPDISVTSKDFIFFSSAFLLVPMKRWNMSVLLQLLMACD